MLPRLLVGLLRGSAGDASWSRWLAALATVLVCLQVLRLAIRKLTLPVNPPPVEDMVEAEDYEGLSIPHESHIEIVFDPLTSLFHSNSAKPFHWENTYTKGRCVFFHPPTGRGDKFASDAGPVLDHAGYFKGKRRLWEFRSQLTFKRVPSATADIFFGIELAEYVHMNAASKRVVQAGVAGVRQAVGGVYHTVGDDPRHVCGELELPHIVLPLWAFDQFIETRPGEQPPDLCDPNFPNLGKKRSGRVQEYVKEMAALREGFDVDTIYTFAFWGVARFLKPIEWQMCGIPFLTPYDFNQLCGKPPVTIVIYTLDKQDLNVEAEEKRHLQSRKDYIFRCRVWSSKVRPVRPVFEALIGAIPGGLNERLLSKNSTGSKKSKSLHGWLRGQVNSTLACCVLRPSAELNLKAR